MIDEISKTGFERTLKIKNEGSPFADYFVGNHFSLKP
jgi:hypothetical protein